MKRLLLCAFLLPLTPAWAVPPKAEETKIDIISRHQGYSVTDMEINTAIRRAATTTADYYGKFPVPKLKVTVQPLEGNPSGIFGRMLDGTEVIFYLGKEVKSDKLKRDWILTHEMFHLGFPSLEDQDPDWLGEGLATYQEPMARTRAGIVNVSDYWAEAIDGISDAQPRPGEGGLNSESRYRRIYWGGAYFWLLMDLEIREKSANKKSLDDALIKIWKDDGTARSAWKLKKFMTKFDAAVGFPIIQKYYDRFGPKAAKEDLPAFWKKLGVSKNGNVVSFDDSAPLTKIRKSLTSPR